MKMSMRFCLLCAMCWMLVATASYAQDDQPEPPMPGPGAERVEQLKKIRLMEQLKLDEETSIRFFSRYTKHQENLREFQKQRQQVLRRVEALRNANASDAELEKAIQELRSMDGRFLEIRDNHWKDVREILSAKQFASYIVFEHNFQRYLRELMRDMQRERMGGRGQSRGR